MKIPLVATTRGGIPEIVREGETGLLYDDPCDVKALTDKLLVSDHGSRSQETARRERKGLHGEELHLENRGGKVGKSL